MGGLAERRFLSAKGSYHPGGIEKSSNPDNLCNGAGPRRHQLTPFRFAVETIFRRRRKRPETKAAYLPRQPNNGDRHVGPHPKRDLPQIHHHRTSRRRPPRGNAMIEAVMALSVFFSVSIFLAHAFDAYRMR
jgi:hypothetical protein